MVSVVDTGSSSLGSSPLLGTFSCVVRFIFQVCFSFLAYCILHTEPVKLKTVQLSSAVCIIETYFPTTVKLTIALDLVSSPLELVVFFLLYLLEPWWYHG